MGMTSDPAVLKWSMFQNLQIYAIAQFHFHKKVKYFYLFMTAVRVT